MPGHQQTWSTWVLTTKLHVFCQVSKAVIISKYLFGDLMTSWRIADEIPRNLATLRVFSKQKAVSVMYRFRRTCLFICSFRIEKHVYCWQFIDWTSCHSSSVDHRISQFILFREGSLTTRPRSLRCQKGSCWVHGISACGDGWSAWLIMN